MRFIYWTGSVSRSRRMGHMIWPSFLDLLSGLFHADSTDIAGQSQSGQVGLIGASVGVSMLVERLPSLIRKSGGPDGLAHGNKILTASRRLAVESLLPSLRT